VLPEESDEEPTEGRSSARRGGFAARADLSNPQAEVVSVPASNRLQIKGESNPASFPPSSSIVAPAPLARRSRDEGGSLSKGRRQPLKLLGKSVPVVLMEYAMPYKLIAEIGPTADWSRLAVAIRTFYDPEYAKRREK